MKFALIENFERTISIMGYSTTADFLKKFLLPLLAIVLVVFLAVQFFFPNISIIYSLIILVIGLGIIIFYPFSIVERKKSNINNNMHLFITYAGTISTMGVSRAVLWKRIAQKKVFGEISNIAEKILYLSTKWNIGFAKTARMVGQRIPSKILGDFLDRFAVMMDFGEDLQIFLVEEQDAVMDDYATEYKKSLETIKLLQDVFISLTMAVAFGIAIGLLLPLLMGISINLVILISTFAIFFMDVVMLVVIKAVIPEDKLYHDLEIKDAGTKRMQKLLYFLAPISFVIFIACFFLFGIQLLLSMAIAFTPMMGLGLIAKSEENTIYRRDVAFPVFIRTLGSATEIRSGALITSLSVLQVHDFGLLNNMAINLYRRLRIGSDKYVSWRFFAGETGSNLIFHFSRIFSEAVYLGGNAEKIGVIISKNFQKILSLRKQKYQIASGLRGAFYGSLIGFCATSFVSAEIVKILAKLFTAQTQAGSFDLANILGSGTNANLFVDLQQVTIYVGIMIIIHSVVSSLLLKVVDGGSFFSSFFDMGVMIWLGAILSIVIPKVVHQLVPDIENTINATEIQDSSVI